MTLSLRLTILTSVKLFVVLHPRSTYGHVRTDLLPVAEVEAEHHQGQGDSKPQAQQRHHRRERNLYNTHIHTPKCQVINTSYQLLNTEALHRLTTGSDWVNV